MYLFTFGGPRGILCCLAITCLLLFTPSQTFSQEEKAQKTYYKEKAEKIVPGAKYVREGEPQQYPAHVKFAAGKTVAADNFTSFLKKSFEMDNDVGFELEEEKVNRIGLVHRKYIQTYKGVPIDRAEYIAHIKDQQVTAFSGDAYKIPEMDVTPAMSEAEALQNALTFIGAEKYFWEVDFWEKRIKESEENPKATWYPDGKLIVTPFGNTTKGEFRLAYRFDIYALDPAVEKRVFVDALNGEILYTLPLASNCEDPVNFSSVFNGTQSVRTEKYTSDDYRLRDNCQAAVIHVWDWGSDTSNYDNSVIEEIENTDNSWTSQDERFGASVLWATKESYSYFLDEHSRSSYDGSNGGVNAFINAVFSSAGGDYVDNASMSFSGGFMKVGEGAEVGLADSWGTVDIIGHEYTHAVTGSSSGLVYQGESGALNESFSDIFGEMIEYYTTSSNDWLMGDDRSDGYIRKMSDPNDKNDPDTYGGTYWIDTSSNFDNGGVHINSGVQNYWFYLLSEGGSGTNDNGEAFEVIGIGREKASIIAFENLVFNLTSGSHYSDARDGAILAAEVHYGDCSMEVEQTINAWHAVGVGEPFVDVTADSPDKPGGYDISCNGGSDGEITLELTGTPPFIINWDHGPTSSSLTGLSAGTYSVTVEDATGCSASTSITLEEPPVLTASADAISDYNGYDISCHGGSDGIAEAIPGGGAPPYSYSWDDDASQSTKVATGLSSGTYTVIVTDANGCTESASVTLTEPDPLLIDAGDNQTVYYGYGPAECAELSWSGAQGGVGAYTITWSTGEVSQSIIVCPDTTTYYYVMITDGNNCVAVDSVKVCSIDVRCGNKLDKVEICHYPPENPENPETLCVGYNSVEEHLSHGDSLAACGTVHSCSDMKSAIASGKPDKNKESGLIVYPNPFNSYTNIQFHSEMEGNYTLRLVSHSGVMVSELFSAGTEKGKWYHVQLSGENLRPGMYFAMLQKPDGSVETVKVIINR